MARVKVRVPELRLNVQDVVFIAHTPDNEKIGELHLSNGSVDWWPRNARTKVRLRWKKFAEVMEEQNAQVQRRPGRRWRKSTQPKS